MTSENKQLFIYRIRPTRTDMLSGGPNPEEERIIGEHFNYLKALTDHGTVLHAGRTLSSDEESFGIVIFRASSEKAAKNLMEDDPAVKEKVMKARLFPYRSALLGDWRE